tara:strand:+ start:92 stop:379 length:288 start_codon:yes stop_codon:yes gene_type:complete
MKNKHTISVEVLHLIAGFSLITSGIIVCFNNEFEMGFSWGIFGAMYVSMSDIGEDEMSEEKQKKIAHKNRRLFAFFGALFSLILVFYYLKNIFFQ